MGNCLVVRKGGGSELAISTCGASSSGIVFYGDVIDTKDGREKKYAYCLCYNKESGSSDSSACYAGVDGSNDNSTWTQIKKAYSNINIYGGTGDSGIETTTYRYLRVSCYIKAGGSRARATIVVIND